VAKLPVTRGAGGFGSLQAVDPVAADRHEGRTARQRVALRPRGDGEAQRGGVEDRDARAGGALQGEDPGAERREERGLPVLGLHADHRRLRQGLRVLGVDAAGGDGFEAFDVDLADGIPLLPVLQHQVEVLLGRRRHVFEVLVVVSCDDSAVLAINPSRVPLI
jgi:hypothetical protein